MKFILVLLAAMIGAVCGAQLGAEMHGTTKATAPCSEKITDALYDKCVVGEAVNLGFDVNHTRRLELKGNRELQASGCSGCSGTYAWPHWCVLMGCDGGRRRHLTIADEHVQTERFLYKMEQIETAALVCLRTKIEDGCTCLGAPEELTITIFLQH
jgi:hypothetical protein